MAVGEGAGKHACAGTGITCRRPGIRYDCHSAAGPALQAVSGDLFLMRNYDLPASLAVFGSC